MLYFVGSLERFKAILRKLLNISASGPIREWAAFFLIGLLGFSFIRAGLLVIQHFRNGMKIQPGLVFSAFIAGIKPDLMMLGFISLLPAAIALIFYIILNDRKIALIVRKASVYLAFAILSVSFAIGFIDMEFWPIFGERVNSALIGWLQTPLVSAGVAVRSYSLIQYSLILIAFCLLLGYILKRIIRIEPAKPTTSFLSRFIVAALILTAITWNARGTFETRRAIEIGASFFSDDVQINQLTLNSPLNFVLSMYNERDLKDSFLLRKESGSSDYTAKYCTPRDPVARPGNRRNVFLILTESLTSNGVRSLGGLQSPHLSPELDSLVASGTSFVNFYSNNAHTGHALFNIFTGIPNPPGPALTSTRYGTQNRITWLKRLQSSGYHTAFFMTHIPLFDNMLGFLKTIGASEIVSVDDYDESFPRGPWGVFDEVMFNDAIRRFQEHNKVSKDPVSYIMLTSTNHTPWEFLPDPLPFDFDPGQSDRKDQYKAYRYTDWAIGNFVRKILAEDPNAIIVITGDHGQLLTIKFKRADVVSNYFHVPLIIVAKNHPMVVPGRRSNAYGSHIDVGKSILDLLGMQSELPSMGQSLFQPAAQKNSVPLVLNDGLGLMDSSYFYFYFQSGLASMVGSTSFGFEGTAEETEKYRKQLMSTFEEAYWLLDHPSTICGTDTKK